MTFTVEDGTGVAAANANMTVAEFQAYHTDRGTDFSDFGTPEIQQGIIQATDYIERIWGLRFLGNKEFRDISSARGTLTLTALPIAAAVVVVGATTYTWDTDMAVGASIEASIDNLVAAIVDPLVTVQAANGDTMRAEAVTKGSAANTIITTTDTVGASWTAATLQGGRDTAYPQPLSFPRVNLIDREALLVLGMPDKLKFATAEYAFRALSATLLPDPTIDATGRAITSKKEVIGPIEVATTFAEGATIEYIIKPYPAADRLLSEYVTGRRVIRG